MKVIDVEPDLGVKERLDRDQKRQKLWNGYFRVTKSHTGDRGTKCEMYAKGHGCIARRRGRTDLSPGQCHWQWCPRIVDE